MHRALVEQGENRRAYVAAASAAASTPTAAVVTVTRTERSAAGTEGRGTGREWRAEPTECVHCFFMHSHALTSHSIP